MSWGHATSTDLTHWDEQPVALLARGFPHNVTEMYFTGSMAIDTNNTSGFGVDGKVPLVAVYTSYYPMTQTLQSGKNIRLGQQSQSIAYSLDSGMTWTTYDAGNPVIQDPPAPYEDQYENFRDPFVFWHEQTQKWVLLTSLAEIHKLVIWTSDNLKEWSVASEFGPFNGVGGVWECPNLFPLPVDNDDAAEKWVLVVGLNPGGPPGTVGSGNQYFIGDFNGTAFIPDSETLHAGNSTSNWLDWGPDYYASAAYNGLSDDRHVQLGWMNNWQYGENIPTYPWRSAMTAPRHLSLKEKDGQTVLVQMPHANWDLIDDNETISHSWNNFQQGTKDLGSIGKTLGISLSFSIREGDASGKAEFGVIVHASLDFTEQTRIGYNFNEKKIFVDRRRSGNIAFDDTFARQYFAPVTPESDGKIELCILVDWSSVEVFSGGSTITTQVFPGEDATYAQVFSSGTNTDEVSLKISKVPSIWN
ncbi:Extracellular exo-inulinase inuE [Penicillium angulare]|uniref:Extracellular exo-inulinase inuE n=1 Tax=Penicillium angulare TaxID=116970 RepID=UPI002540AFF6|nr:Extracellular exo-inulinase inuE [Penicillium angulare]KAJ5263573.1 Extracellular exo-inulinase inuE [Penicillium angulare]